jgi:translation initiation factor IF-2
MTKTTDQGEKKKTLTLSKKLDVKKVVESDQVRQSFSHGRSKAVAVEVKRKRVTLPGEVVEEKPLAQLAMPPIPQTPPAGDLTSPSEEPTRASSSAGRLTEDELVNRLKVVQDALKAGAMEAEERARREASRRGTSQRTDFIKSSRRRGR